MKKEIKKGKVTAQVEQQKKTAEFNDDLKGFFGERDKTNRGLEGKTEILEEESKAEIEVREILYKESLKETPIPPGYSPMFSGLFLTAKRNQVSTLSGILIAEEGVSVDCDYQEVQTIMAVGAQIKNDKDGLRPGWEVAVNFDNFRDFRAAKSGSMADKVTKAKELNVPIITIDNVDYISMGDRDVRYIVNNLKQLENE